MNIKKKQKCMRFGITIILTFHNPEYKQKLNKRCPPLTAGESQQEPEYQRWGFGGEAPIKPGEGRNFRRLVDIHSAPCEALSSECIVSSYCRKKRRG